MDELPTSAKLYQYLTLREILALNVIDTPVSRNKNHRLIPLTNEIILTMSYEKKSQKQSHNSVDADTVMPTTYETNYVSDIFKNILFHHPIDLIENGTNSKEKISNTDLDQKRSNEHTEYEYEVCTDEYRDKLYIENFYILDDRMNQMENDLQALMKKLSDVQKQFTDENYINGQVRKEVHCYLRRLSLKQDTQTNVKPVESKIEQCEQPVESQIEQSENIEKKINQQEEFACCSGRKIAETQDVDNDRCDEVPHSLNNKKITKSCLIKSIVRDNKGCETKEKVSAEGNKEPIAADGKTAQLYTITAIMNENSKACNEKSREDGLITSNLKETDQKLPTMKALNQKTYVFQEQKEHNTTEDAATPTEMSQQDDDDGAETAEHAAKSHLQTEPTLHESNKNLKSSKEKKTFFCTIDEESNVITYSEPRMAVVDVDGRVKSVKMSEWADVRRFIKPRAGLSVYRVVNESSETSVNTTSSRVYPEQNKPNGNQDQTFKENKDERSKQNDNGHRERADESNYHERRQHQHDRVHYGKSVREQTMNSDESMSDLRQKYLNKVLYKMSKKRLEPEKQFSDNRNVSNSNSIRNSNNIRKEQTAHEPRSHILKEDHSSNVSDEELANNNDLRAQYKQSIEKQQHESHYHSEDGRAHEQRQRKNQNIHNFNSLFGKTVNSDWWESNTSDYESQYRKRRLKTVHYETSATSIEAKHYEKEDCEHTPKENKCIIQKNDNTAVKVNLIFYVHSEQDSNIYSEDSDAHAQRHGDMLFGQSKHKANYQKSATMPANLHNQMANSEMSMQEARRKYYYQTMRQNHYNNVFYQKSLTSLKLNESKPNND